VPVKRTAIAIASTIVALRNHCKDSWYQLSLQWFDFSWKAIPTLVRFTTALLILVTVGFIAPATPAKNASLQFNVAAEELFRRNKFSAARKSYEESIKGNPENVKLRIGLVRTLLRLDEWRYAVAEGYEAAQRHAQDADSRALYALALLRAGWPDLTEREAEVATKLDPNNYWVLIATGRVALWKRQQQKAARLFRRAATMRPDEPDGWLGLFLSLDVGSAEHTAAAEVYVNLAPQGQPHRWHINYAREVVRYTRAYGKRYNPDRVFAAVEPLNEAQLRRLEKAGGQFSISVPIEQQGEYIFLPVVINKQRIRLIFDTGGGTQVLLNATAAKRLNLQALKTTKTNSIQGEELTTWFQADTLTIGSGGSQRQAFKDVPVYALQSDQLAGDGIFGASLFRRYRVTLDLSANTLTLARGRQARQSNKSDIIIPFSSVNDWLLFRARVADEPVWVTFDTGSAENNLSLFFARQLATRLNKNEWQEWVHHGKIAIGNTATEITYLRLSRTFPLSTMDLKAPFVLNDIRWTGASFLDGQISALCDLEIAAQVGVSFLRKFKRMTIDYPSHTLRLDPL